MGAKSVSQDLVNEKGNISVKNQKCFRLCGPTPATIPQLCRGNTKVVIDNTLTDGRGDLPIKLYVETQSVAWVWLLGHSFLIPFLDHGF